MRPKYRIIIEKNNNELTVQEIALVDEPAVEIDFLYFNKDKKPLYFNEEKMIVAGVLMVPDKLIYRYDEDMGEYDVFFTPDDIENARYNFKKYGLTNQFNEGHSDKKVNVVLIEDYILDEADTRVEKYGFTNLPKGTWFGISKVEDYDTWQKIKSGELRGFSVEGLFQLKQTFKKKENMVVEPRAGETKDDFIGRCIGTEINSGMSEEQAAAVCYTKWEDYGIDNMFNVIESEGLGLSRDDMNIEEFDIQEMTYVKEGDFAVSWNFPDWMKPKDTGEGEIKEPTDNQIDRQEKEQGQPPVYYFYDKKPGAQFDSAGIIDDRSRQFCIRLVNQNKYFTKADIDRMSGAAGFDVFLYAGGKNCRHNWYIAIPIFEGNFRHWRKNADMYFESYTDYPKAASENAQRALNWVEKNGWGSCGTPVGKARANQLAKGEPISRDTIARMAAFERHRQNKNTPYGEGCGRLMWDSWGGDEGIEWAQRKLEQIEKEQKLNKDEVNDISSIKIKSNKMKKITKSIEKFVIQTELQDGTEVIVDADELVEGARVEVKVASEGDVAETDMYEAAPDGEHTLADGTVITTEGGLITSISKPSEEPTEEPTEEVEAGKDKKYKMEITDEDLVVIMEALQPKFDEITSMIAELASKINVVEEDVEVQEDFNKAKASLSYLDKLQIVKQSFKIN